MTQRKAAAGSRRRPDDARAYTASASEGIGDDSVADAIIELLRAEGAAAIPHAGGRTLLEHLVGTYAIARRWHQPRWLAHAALIHSVYGTEAFRTQLLPPARRAELAAVAGVQAERTAHLFAVTPRGPLLAGTHRWSRGLMGGEARDERGELPTADQLDAVLVLHIANLAEQSEAADHSPGRWLGALGRLGGLLSGTGLIQPPTAAARIAGFSDEDEASTVRHYRSAFADSGPAIAGHLALAAATCPVVAEPCVWRAYLSRREGDLEATRAWAGQAHERLALLGVPWDKRLSYETWSELIDAIAVGSLEPVASSDRGLPDPRRLHAAIRRDGGRDGSATRAVGPGTRSLAPPDEQAARWRFHRYVDALAESDTPASGAFYPELESAPWLQPAGFPITAYLEEHAGAIRREILALGDGAFHGESERIRRRGSWDVAFFWERGKRRGDMLARCPVTARALESYPTVRTLAGLSYVSRMRAGTHIAAHRGPTNLRVRCHLGISVPSGDCALRVGDETRQWVEGKCLVFDDSIDHEAWNHSTGDRVVLIIDLWHPGLAEVEVALLEGLHRYGAFHARSLSRYWLANAAKAQNAPSPPSPKSPKSPPSPPSPPSPSPNRPSPPNRPPTAASPKPSPAPSADPISSPDSNPEPPKPL
jgi:aspartate beta-hydroxylase